MIKDLKYSISHFGLVPTLAFVSVYALVLISWACGLYVSL